MTDQPPEAAHLRSGLLTRGRDRAADAVRFFTRLPVPERWGLGAPQAAMSGIAAAAPVAGAIVGAGCGALLIAGLAFGLPPLPATTFAVAAAVALSGALHLDGLADCADGFGGGATAERKLEIMRDSQLGSFGGAALALALIARVTVVAALVDRLGASEAALALVAAGALSRPFAFLPTLALSPARPDGLGAAATPSRGAIATGGVIGAAAALLLAGPAPGLAAIGLGGAAVAAVIAVARRQIGGHTGDVCGAAAELAEIAALAGMLCVAGPV